MAQLIKLLDYVSRYESNPFHYPPQYIRLKQEHWKRLNELWEAENERENDPLKHAEEYENDEIKIKRKPFFKKRKREQENKAEHRQFPATKEGLTRFFLNELYPFQMKWATSTISEVSYTDEKYTNDDALRQFLQRLPDIYLLMYYPIFSIKKAPIEADIILISPLEIEIISLLKESPEGIVYADSDRTWTIEKEGRISNMISPVISLKRTEQIVKGVLKKYRIDFPIKKSIISFTTPIIVTNEPYKTAVIGNNQYSAWIEEKRALTSPLKSVQLKTVEALLNHCQSTSVKRPEWINDDDGLMPTYGKETE